MVRWGSLGLALALATSAFAEPPGGPAWPVSPAPTGPSIQPVPPFEPPREPTRPGVVTRPGSSSTATRPTLPPLDAAPPSVAPLPQNPARELLRDRRERERCATGQITRDRHGRACP
jgi:hypothetical protein